MNFSTNIIIHIIIWRVLFNSKSYSTNKYLYCCVHDIPFRFSLLFFLILTLCVVYTIFRFLFYFYFFILSFLTCSTSSLSTALNKNKILQSFSWFYGTTYFLSSLFCRLLCSITIYVCNVYIKEN